MNWVVRSLLIGALAAAFARAGEDAEPQKDQLPVGVTRNLGKLKNQGEKMALSPDGALLAALDDAGRVYLFDTAKPTKPVEFDAGGPCHGVDFSADGKFVITAGPVKDISIWNATTGKLERKLEGSQANVCAVAMSQDGTRLAGTDETGALRIWDFTSGKIVHDLKPTREKTDPEQPFSEGLAFSPDGRYIVTESNDEKARCWDAIRGVELHVLREHNNDSPPVSIAPGGALAATTQINGVIRLWRLDSGEVERVISGHAASVVCTAFVPDGFTILSGAQDRTIRQWDIETGLELRRFATQVKPVSIAVAPDSTAFFTLDEDGRVLKWNLTGAPEGFEPTPPLPPLDTAWEKLESLRYDVRATGVWTYLLSDSEQATAHLYLRLTDKGAASEADLKQARALIAQLDDARADVREKAFEALRVMKEKARAALAETLVNPPSAEVRHRAATLLGEGTAPGEARSALALEILGTMHSTASKQALTRLSERDGAQATRARAVLMRMWSN